MLSSVRLDGATERIVVDVPVDRAMFTEYIAQILAPVLRSGDIVIFIGP
jgi:hypothetical protein